MKSFLSACLVLGFPLVGHAQTPPRSASAFNPDIGINLLGLYRTDNEGSNDPTSDERNGLSFQEAELQFAADVDPYLRAAALFSLAEEGGEWAFEPEETYFESLSIPRLTLRAGKFKAAFGRHNQLHTHGYPFVDAPLISRALLGDEGLNDFGASAALLIPTTWFSELTLQGFAARNEILFASSNSNDIASVAYLRNLWDLSDDVTLELGLYGAEGANQYSARSEAYGGDLILKWRPSVGGKYHALIWQTQYQAGSLQGHPTQERQDGIATWIQLQFARRWWCQLREEHEGISDDLPTRQRQSVLLGFFPSEFSGFRLQYDHLRTDGLPTSDALTLQYNVSIGAHPAHAY